jgi:hypothetical protein
MKKSTLSLASMFLFASTLAAGAAQAGNFDERRCFKVKERTHAFRATVNLSTMEDESTVAVDPGCQITGRVTPEQVARTWASERYLYEYPSDVCAGRTCGHYTQMVWRETRNIGCAVQVCTTGNPSRSDAP